MEKNKLSIEDIKKLAEKDNTLLSKNEAEELKKYKRGEILNEDKPQLLQENN